MMPPIDAYHLPGPALAWRGDWDIREYDDGGLSLRFPRLDPAALEELLERIGEAGTRHLKERPVAEIVDAIDRAAAELQDPDGEARRLLERALPAVTGYSAPMVSLMLERMARDWRKPALVQLLEAELGDARVLDSFLPRPGAPGTRSRAYGAKTAFHIFAGNVPGVAVTSIVRSLLVKTPVLGKMASGEPLTAAVFAQALAQVDPGLAECVAVTYWAGGHAGLEATALAKVDLVVAYGGEEAVAEVRGRVPAGRRLVVYGPRLSFGLVGREALETGGRETTAHAIARAVAIFDQQGCVSPHLVYVERGGDLSPETFAALVAEWMEKVEAQLPRGRLSAAEAARIQEERSAAEFRSIGGSGIRLFASADTAHTVIYDPDPAFVPSCLNRLLRIKPIDLLEDAVALVRPYRAYLQTVGVAAGPERLQRIADSLGGIGVSRITSFERMPWPPPTWRHDGMPPLGELVSWTDLEADGQPD